MALPHSRTKKSGYSRFGILCIWLEKATVIQCCSHQGRHRLRLTKALSMCWQPLVRGQVNAVLNEAGVRTLQVRKERAESAAKLVGPIESPPEIGPVSRIFFGMKHEEWSSPYLLRHGDLLRLSSLPRGKCMRPTTESCSLYQHESMSNGKRGRT